MDDQVIGSVKGFHVTLGFVLNLLITFTVVIIAFATLRNDTFIALQNIEKQEAVLVEQQKTIIDMRMTIQRIVDDNDYFHKQYNEDMNRYIRERPKQ